VEVCLTEHVTVLIQLHQIEVLVVFVT